MIQYQVGALCQSRRMQHMAALADRMAVMNTKPAYRFRGATWAQKRVLRQPKVSDRKCTSCRTLSRWRRYLHRRHSSQGVDPS